MIDEHAPERYLVWLLISNVLAILIGAGAAALAVWL